MSFNSELARSTAGKSLNKKLPWMETAPVARTIAPLGVDKRTPVGTEKSVNCKLGDDKLLPLTATKGPALPFPYIIVCTPPLISIDSQQTKYKNPALAGFRLHLLQSISLSETS